MKRYLLAVVAVAAMLPLSGTFAENWWSGPEIGIQGGYAFDGSSGTFSCPDAVATCTTSGTDPNIVTHYSINPTGGLGGAHAGYNWQWDHAVLGLEADAEGADVSGSTTNTVRGFGASMRMDFDASIRGKLGWAFDNVLLYGTGGAAFGDVTTNYRASATPGGPLLSVGGTSGVRVGWTGGAGIQCAFTPN